jgi:hypothetical protein
MRKVNKPKFANMRQIKNIGVEADFLRSFRGVFTIKQEHTLGSFSITLNSERRPISVI